MAVNGDRRERLLFVDDDSLLRRAFSRSISVLGIGLDLAESAEEALTLAANRSYAVLVTDLQLPGLSGVELIARHAELDPTTVHVLITGRSDFEFPDELPAGSEGVEQHVYAVLSKPWRLDVLSETLQRALAQYRQRLSNVPSLTELAHRVVG